MAAGNWKFLLTDLQGVVLAEILHADARQVIIPLKSTPTLAFNVEADHPLANYFVDPTFDGLIRAYRNNMLRFNGPLISGQEAGDSSAPAKIAVTASGPFWRLNLNLAGVPATSPGAVIPVSYGSTVSPVDLGSAAQSLVSLANTQAYSGIENGTFASSTSGAAGPYYLQPIGDAIVALSIGSFEWEVVPTEPTNTGHSFPQIGTFNVGASIGTTRNDVVYEFGTGAANLSAYSNAVDRSTRMTFGYIQQPAVADYSDVLAYEDTAASAAGGRFLGVVDNGGVEYDSYRTVLLQRNVNIRKVPRQVVSVTPRANSSIMPFDNFDVGDTFRTRIVNNQKLRLDAMLRCWGVQFDIDAQGNETPTLMLVPPA